MGLFSWLFGSSKSETSASAAETRTTTVNDPFRIANPAIGFLNVAGAVCEETMKGDQQVLQPLFGEARESRSGVPRCEVLFLYGDFDIAGRIVGRNDRLREIIKAAGAYIAVIASENVFEHYMNCPGPRNEWPANVVLTVEREGDKFPKFFAELFRRMYAGESMLLAWVELAPQIPDYDHPDAPGALMAAEAGHEKWSNLVDEVVELGGGLVESDAVFEDGSSYHVW